MKEQYLKEGYQLLKKNAIAKFTLKSLDGATIQGEIINRETIRDNWVVYFEREKGNGIQVLLLSLALFFPQDMPAGTIVTLQHIQVSLSLQVDHYVNKH